MAGLLENEKSEPQAAATDLPQGLESYRRTDAFSEKTVPAGLLNAHATKTGTWGLIRVTNGELLYRIEDERRLPAERRLRGSLYDAATIDDAPDIGRQQFGQRLHRSRFERASESFDD